MSDLINVESDREFLTQYSAMVGQFGIELKLRKGDTVPLAGGGGIRIGETVHLMDNDVLPEVGNPLEDKKMIVPKGRFVAFYEDTAGIWTQVIRCDKLNGYVAVSIDENMWLIDTETGLASRHVFAAE